MGTKKSKSDKKSSQFTLDQPVTREIIAQETGMSTSTLRRRLKEMDFVTPRGLICPEVYKKILVEMDFLPKSILDLNLG